MIRPTLAVPLLCLSLAFTPTFAADFSLQILGSSGPGNNPERAESSVLIKAGDSKILVDMGNGTQGRLEQAGINVRDLNALMITHHHVDHDQEFIPILLKTLLGRSAPLVVGPTNTKMQSDFTTQFYKKDIEYRRSNGGKNTSFPMPEVKEVHGGEKLSVAGVDVSTAAVNHTIETIAYRFNSGGKSIVISGDLYYSESLVELAKGADVLVIDSGGVAALGNGNAGGGKQSANSDRSHSTGDEIIKMVSEAKVKTVVLTHFGARKLNESAIKAAFAQSTDAKVIFATDLLEVTP